MSKTHKRMVSFYRRPNTYFKSFKTAKDFENHSHYRIAEMYMCLWLCLCMLCFDLPKQRPINNPMSSIYCTVKSTLHAIKHHCTKHRDLSPFSKCNLSSLRLSSAAFLHLKFQFQFDEYRRLSCHFIYILYILVCISLIDKTVVVYHFPQNIIEYDSTITKTTCALLYVALKYMN